MAKSTAVGRAAKSTTISAKTARGRAKKTPVAHSGEGDDQLSMGAHVGGAFSEPESRPPEPEIVVVADATETRDGGDHHEQVTQPERRLGLDAAKMFFDAVWYRETYEDVRHSGVDPVQHYMTFGYLEGRNPNAAFSTLGYIAANPDIANAGINAFLHYILHGASEGRPTGS